MADELTIMEVIEGRLKMDENLEREVGSSYKQQSELVVRRSEFSQKT